MIGTKNSVRLDLLIEMAFWFKGTHYVYSDNADKIFSWLMDGGVSWFSPQEHTEAIKAGTLVVRQRKKIVTNTSTEPHVVAF